MFHDDSYWRDVLAFTWHIVTVNGANAIGKELKACSRRAQPRGFSIDPQRAAPRKVKRAGTEAIEAIFQFENAEGRCSGVLRLTPDASDGGKLKAWTLLTALEEIKGHEEQFGRSGPQDKAYLRDFHGPNWCDTRQAAAAYADRDPAVLVVGSRRWGFDRRAPRPIAGRYADRRPRTSYRRQLAQALSRAGSP